MASRLINVAHTQGASNLTTVGYTLNAVGNRTAKNVAWASLPMHSEIYTYDPIDQLVTANYNGSNTVAYDYDPVGNRTSVSATTSAPGVGTYTTNNLNQYTNAQGKVNLHDSRGNLTKVGIDLTFDYDSKNRLTSAQNGTNTMTVAYGYQNRQVSRTINGTTVYFIYDGWSLLQERDSTGNLLQTYVHGPEIGEILRKQNTTGEVYYHHDGLGSTVALTDVQGDLVESYSYDVFGSVTVYDSTFSILNFSFFQNRFLFTGREWIREIGIYDYRNRIYSPELGRFLQTDPIRFEAGDVNLYRYVGNRASISSDPLGLEEKCCDGSKLGNWVGNIRYSFRALVIQSGSFEGNLTCDCKPGLKANVSGSVNGLLLVGFSSGTVQISVRAKEKSQLRGKSGPLLSAGVNLGVGPVGVGGSVDLTESSQGGMKGNPNSGIGVDPENINPTNPGASFGVSLLFWAIHSAD
jgi:RHS repeat-associated protein